MKREIEKKYLIENIDARDALVSKLGKIYPGLKHKGTKTVISYFYERGATRGQIISVGSEILNKTQLRELDTLLKNSGEQIVKCRSIDDTVYFAVKGTATGEDPVHAVNRLEFEAVVEKDLEDIDMRLQKVGISLVSKWSAIRDFYELDRSIKADIEFVAGYGHKAELEVLINDGESAEATLKALDELAVELDLVEADSGLLARMYQYYNLHWQTYFNTSKVFGKRTWAELGRE